MQRSDDLVKRAPMAMDRRNLLKLFGAAAAAGVVTPALAACGSSDAPTRTSQTLRIGMVYPQSGPLQNVGFEMVNGFQLYLNSNGNTIGGMSVQFKGIDEGTSATSGQAAVNAALKSEAYDVIVGVANSDVMAGPKGIPDAVTAARIPLLGTFGSPASMRASDFIWRTSFVNGEASRALGIYLSSLAPSISMHTGGALGRPSRIAVYSDGSSDSAAETNAFLEQLGASGIALHGVSGAPGPDLMSRINNYNPDLVYAATSGDNATAFLKAYRGSSAPLCGPGALTELSAQSSAAQGVFTSMNYAPDISNDANQQFSSAYFTANTGKVPTTYAMTSYDAALVLDAAIGQISGQVTPLAINQALGSAGVFDSPRGRWQFNQTRTPLQQWYLRQVRPSGKFLENTVLADLATMS